MKVEEWPQVISVIKVIYENLVLVLEPIHKLIHAQKPEPIAYYLEMLNLNPEQLKKVNNLRKQAGILEIESEPGEGDAA